MALNVPFTSLVRTVADGDGVTAANANKSATDLTQRTNHLKQQLDSLEAGQLLKVTNAVLETGMTIGSPVYLDTDNVFKPAIVALAEDAVGGAAAGTSYVFGVLLTKETATSGSLGLLGRITTLVEADWASVIDGGVWAAGHYFLSGENPGKITTAPGSLAVYVGQMLPDATFLLRAAPPVYGAHTHYQFELTGAPAGTVVDPGVGDPQVVDTPDTSAAGWLPAESPYFATEQIPVGAVFGYNLAHTSAAALLAVFPPIPLDGATFAQSGLLLDTTKVTVNEFGIWWMDNTYGNAPWPVDYAATTTAEDVTFWFSRLLYATDAGVVTRLENDPASLLDIQILNASGVTAHAGKLKLKVTSLLPNDGDDNTDTLAVTEIEDGVHRRSPMTRRVVPGAGIVVTGEAGDSTEGFYGKVVISASNSNALQGSVALVNLHNARRDEIQDLNMVTLPAGRDVAPVFQIEVSKLAPATNKLRLKPWLYSSSSGNTPAISVQYRIIPSTAANTALPTGWTTLGSGLGSVAVVSGQMKQVDVTPDISSVPAGSIVLIKLARTGSSDGFAGNVGIPRFDYALV